MVSLGQSGSLGFVQACAGLCRSVPAQMHAGVKAEWGVPGAQMPGVLCTLMWGFGFLLGLMDLDGLGAIAGGLRLADRQMAAG